MSEAEIADVFGIELADTASAVQPTVDVSQSH